MNEVYIRRRLEEFLLEDLGHTEVDARNNKRLVEAVILAEENGIFCGGIFIEPAFDLLTPVGTRRTHRTYVRKLLEDGKSFIDGTELVKFEVNAEILRYGIRTILNLLQHLSGIATQTRRMVERVERYGCKLLDTRKTTPGLRVFEKYAVRVGGGVNHRFGRFDGILIKKEDIQIDGGIKQAIDRAYCNKSHLVAVEVEVETLEEVEEVLKDKRVSHILLDNMDVDTLRRAVVRCVMTHTLEASGVDEKNLEEVALAGVHFISTSSLIRGTRPSKMKMRTETVE